MQVISEEDNTIKNFTRIEETAGAVPIQQPGLEFKAGQPPAYVFLDRDGAVIAGQLQSIRTNIKEVMDSKRVPAGICLQIAELIGTAAERYSFRRITLRRIEDLSLGDKAGKAFGRSIKHQDDMRKKSAELDVALTGREAIEHLRSDSLAPRYITLGSAEDLKNIEAVQAAGVIIEGRHSQPNFKIQKVTTISVLRMPITIRDS